MAVAGPMQVGPGTELGLQAALQGSSRAPGWPLTTDTVPANPAGVIQATNTDRIRGRDDRRSMLLGLATLVAIAVAVVGAFLLFRSTGLSSSLGACAEVTSAACQPDLSALYDQLGEEGDDVASIRARPWCGLDECQLLFGADVIRLRVEFIGGRSAEYSCSRPFLEKPDCQVADKPST